LNCGGTVGWVSSGAEGSAVQLHREIDQLFRGTKNRFLADELILACGARRLGIPGILHSRAEVLDGLRNKKVVDPGVLLGENTDGGDDRCIENH
jgi:hypothetical protein